LIDGPARSLHVTDLGAAWRAWTGLPMVFAVWAARRDYLAAHPERVESVARAFHESVQAANTYPSEVARAAVDQAGLTLADAERYYKALDFRLGQRQRDGIVAFTEAVAQLLGWQRIPELTYL
jgi:chorismate dehydratase